MNTAIVAKGARLIAAAVLVSSAALVAATVPAQSQLSAKAAEVQQLVQANKQQLSRYTWQVQETVSVSGDVKSADVYQVQIGPDGQQVRTLVAQPVAPQASARQHGIKHRMTQDFQDYAKQVAALAKSYAQLSPQKLQQLAAAGNVAVRPGGAPGYASVVISNYLKPGDSIVLTITQNPKALYSVKVSSYLSGPSDAVTVQAGFAALPDGTHYAATTTVNGVSKNLKIVDQSVNFAPRSQ